VKNGTRGFRQGCRRNLGFAAGRVPQPHPECRDSSRGFSSESVDTPAGAKEAIASRHFPRRACNEKERFSTSPHPTQGALSLRGLAGCVIALRTVLDAWSPQLFLAERMIIIVTDFRSEVVKFIFGGRSSGQSRKEEDTLPSYDAKKRQGQPGTGKQDPNLYTWDHGAPNLPRLPVCTFARRIQSGPRNMR